MSGNRFFARRENVELGARHGMNLPRAAPEHRGLSAGRIEKEIEGTDDVTAIIKV